MKEKKERKQKGEMKKKKQVVCMKAIT